jgi:serine/threonine protein kinase
LITLLATYKHSGTYHLIFPWAETDLFGYWKLFPDPLKDEATATWLIEQCRGIAEGLYTIHRYETISGTSLLHVFGLGTGQKSQESLRPVRRESANTSHAKNFYGRHGDLKPENILWFPDPSGKTNGVLKITDFGIARFNTENEWEHRCSGRPPNSPTYRSPEIDLEGRLSTACDVWALGCVYLQFITWYFGGESYLDQFGKKRFAIDDYWAGITTDTFFTIYEESGIKKAKVKDAVVQMIEDLHEHQRCTEDFRTFLDIIRRDMLVVHHPNPPYQEEVASLMLLGSIPGSLNVPGQDSPRRKSCGDIHRMLGDIKPRCDQDSVFTRRSTMEPTSPIAQSYFNWSQERSASPTPLPRAPPGRRRSSGFSFRKQGATANGSSAPKSPGIKEEDQKESHREHMTHSYGLVQVPP